MIASLRREDLRHFEQKLRARERQLAGELEAGRQKADEDRYAQVAGEAPDNGDASLADLVTDATSAERQRDTTELRAVQDALERIGAGTYGLCRKCGQPIDPRRLEAFPATQYDLEHQAEQERQQGGPELPKL